MCKGPKDDWLANMMGWKPAVYQGGGWQRCVEKDFITDTGMQTHGDSKWVFQVCFIAVFKFSTGSVPLIACPLCTAAPSLDQRRLEGVEPGRIQGRMGRG